MAVAPFNVHVDVLQMGETHLVYLCLLAGWVLMGAAAGADRWQARCMIGAEEQEAAG